MFVINRGLVVGAFAALSVAAASAQAQETLRVTSGDVTVVCPLTVGGSFEARTKAVTGEVGPAPSQPGAVPGAIKVKLETLETGIGLRDQHMLDHYLEIGKGESYAVAVIENITIDKLDGKGTFRGKLTLHGQTRDITGTSVVQKRDGAVHVEAQFPVKVSEFQIPKPTYLGVGVKDEIQIKVSFQTQPATSVASR